MIDDDIKNGGECPKELRDHLVLESPQLANVEFNANGKLQQSVLLREIQM